MLNFLLLQGMLLGAYSPPMWGLDSWFIKEGDTWHQFQLAGPLPQNLDRVWEPLEHQNRTPLPIPEQGIYHSTSKDLINWEDKGVVLTVGPPGTWDDGKIYTGNIFKHEGVYYLFYTGIPEHPKPEVTLSPIGVATSTDLITWTKHPENPVMLPDPSFYDPLGDWRDCNFYWDAESSYWYAVVTATAKGEGPPHERACIALMRSQDLIHWEGLPPLVIQDTYRLGLENPFLFEHDGKWYTGHCMYSDFYTDKWKENNKEKTPLGGMFYFMSDSMYGPYTPAPNKGLGLQPDPPPYAVQIIKEEDTYLYMHRGPGRWATALPKKIHFGAAGEMTLVYWEQLESVRGESLLNDSLPEELILDSNTPDIVLGTPGLDTLMECTISFTDDEGAAIINLGNTFLLEINRETGRIGMLHHETKAIRQDRQYFCSDAATVNVKLVADGSVVDVYVNGEYVFAEHRPHPVKDEAQMLHVAGTAKINDLRMDVLKIENEKYTYGFNY